MTPTRCDIRGCQLPAVDQTTIRFQFAGLSLTEERVDLCSKHILLLGAQSGRRVVSQSDAPGTSEPHTNTNVPRH